MRSLQVKFSALVVALLVLASLSLALIATRHERSALADEAVRRAEAVARHLADAVPERLATGGPLVADPSLQPLLEELASGDGIEGVMLLAPSGVIVASSEASAAEAGSDAGSGAIPTPGSEATVKRLGTRWVVSAPVWSAGAPIGEAQVVIDADAAVDAAVRDAALRLSLAGIAVVGLGVVSCVVFAGLLVGPLRRLRLGVEQLTTGQLAVRVPPTSRDEVGELTRAFNEMGDALQQKERIQNAFGRYVNDYVLSQLLEEPDGKPQAGIEREVTILFADIRGFTNLSEGLAAPRVVSLLNEIFQLASDRILEHGGTIDKYMGDSVMAYFGAPVPHPDHTLRGVTAAVEILQAVAERSRRIGAGSDDLPVELGIGVHTGVVVVGNIGSDRRTDFTAVGDAVNVAHRLEKLARPGQILVSEAVQRLVRGALTMRFEGERHLSGREEPVHVYSIQYDATRKPPSSDLEPD